MFLQGFRVQYLPLKGVLKQKNHHLLTFVQMKTVSGVIRSCYLFLQVPMVMKKCLQTYYDIAIALEKFLRSLKSSVVICKIVTFYTILNHFGSKSGLEWYKTQKSSSYVFVNKNGVECRAIIRFASAGTYDHEEVFTNLLHHCHRSKTFLRRTKSSDVKQETVIFRIS